MAENLFEKAQKLGIQPANAPKVSGQVNLLEKAQKLGIQPANPPAEKPTFRGFVARDITGQATEADRPQGFFKGLASDIVKSTVGSSGLTGIFTQPFKETREAATEQIETNKKRDELLGSSGQFIDLAKTEQDPQKKKEYI